jgi:hypothetical protein
MCRGPVCASGARPSHRPHTLSIPLSTIAGIFSLSEPGCKPECEGSRFRTAEPAGQGAHPYGTHTPQPPVRARYRRRVREPSSLTAVSAPERPNRLGPDDWRIAPERDEHHLSKYQIVPGYRNGHMLDCAGLRGRSQSRWQRRGPPRFLVEWLSLLLGRKGRGWIVVTGAGGPSQAVRRHPGAGLYVQGRLQLRGFNSTRWRATP